jgi:hypothetical protein
MSSELSRTIATSDVWLSVAVILTFGLYRMTNGDDLLYLLATALITIPAAVATVAIWAPAVFLGDKADWRRGFEVLPQVQKLD